MEQAEVTTVDPEDKLIVTPTPDPSPLLALLPRLGSGHRFFQRGANPSGGRQNAQTPGGRGGAVRTAPPTPHPGPARGLQGPHRLDSPPGSRTCRGPRHGVGVLASPSGTPGGVGVSASHSPGASALAAAAAARLPMRPGRAHPERGAGSATAAPAARAARGGTRHPHRRSLSRPPEPTGCSQHGLGGAGRLAGGAQGSPLRGARKTRPWARPSSGSRQAPGCGRSGVVWVSTLSRSGTPATVGDTSHPGSLELQTSPRSTAAPPELTVARWGPWVQFAQVKPQQ